jgi:hypothetical protein
VRPQLIGLEDRPPAHGDKGAPFLDVDPPAVRRPGDRVDVGELAVEVGAPEPGRPARRRRASCAVSFRNECKETAPRSGSAPMEERPGRSPYETCGKLRRIH